MDKHIFAENSLGDTLYGADVGGDIWINEHYCASYDFNTGEWKTTNLIRPNGATLQRQAEHKDRTKRLYTYIVKSIAVQRMRDLISIEAHNDK